MRLRLEFHPSRRPYWFFLGYLLHYRSSKYRIPARRRQLATMFDRPLHHAEVTVIEGSSYRVREGERKATARHRGKNGTIQLPLLLL